MILNVYFPPPDDYVFLWDLNTNTYLSYERNRTNPLTSLSWKQDGSHLAVSKKHYLDILGGPCSDTLLRRIATDFSYSSMNWREDLVTCGCNASIVDSYDLRRSSDKPAFSLMNSTRGEYFAFFPFEIVKLQTVYIHKLDCLMHSTHTRKSEHK